MSVLTSKLNNFTNQYFTIIVFFINIFFQSLIQTEKMGTRDDEYDYLFKGKKINQLFEMTRS